MTWLGIRLKAAAWLQAHSEAAEARGKLPEQDRLVAELRHNADGCSCLKGISCDFAGGEARAAAAASGEALAAALQDLKASQVPRHHLYKIPTQGSIRQSARCCAVQVAVHKAAGRYGLLQAALRRVRRI